MAGSRRIEEVDGGVRITTALDIALTGVLRPLTRLLAPSHRRIQEADLDRLVALLTAEAPARPRPRMPRRVAVVPLDAATRR